jgi:hypothetical protein
MYFLIVEFRTEEQVREVDEELAGPAVRRPGLPGLIAGIGGEVRAVDGKRR